MAEPKENIFLKVFFACCVLAGLFLFARQAYITYNDSIVYGGTDLRVRIIGSRFMANGANAYVARWQPGMPYTLCNPMDNFAGAVNGVTVTPFLLWLQQPLAKLNYPQIRMLWWGAQQLMLAGIIAFFVWANKKSWSSIAAILLAAGLLINSAFWFLHADRGQVYILYAAWMTGLFALWHKKETAFIIVAGVWLAFGILLRPPLGIFAFVSFLLLASKQRILLVACCILSIAILVPLSGGLKFWHYYFDAMNYYASIGPPNMYSPTVEVPKMPALIEGATNLTLHKDYSSIIYLGSLPNYFAAIGWRPGPRVYLGIFLVVATLLTSIFILKHRREKASLTQYFLLATLLYMLAEVCQPLRMAYNVIQWLPALLAMLGVLFMYQKKKL